jgi:hypothetical protein
MNEMHKDIRKFIGSSVFYSDEGTMIFGGSPKDAQVLLNVRGWGAIKNLFMENGKFIKDGEKKAEEFHDEFGEWIVDAINQKLSKCDNGEKE